MVVYDDNRISIEDNTQIAKSEDVAARYEAYGWHVQRLDWRHPNGYREDPAGLYQALLEARARTDKPSIIVLTTIIAWPAPHAQNTVRRTARRSVRTRSRPPSKSWASTRR